MGANLKKSREVRKLKREKVNLGNSKKYSLAGGKVYEGSSEPGDGEPAILRREFV